MRCCTMVKSSLALFMYAISVDIPGTYTQMFFCFLIFVLYIPLRNVSPKFTVNIISLMNNK